MYTRTPVRNATRPETKMSVDPELDCEQKMRVRAKVTFRPKIVCVRVWHHPRDRMTDSWRFMHVMRFLSHSMCRVYGDLFFKWVY